MQLNSSWAEDNGRIEIVFFTENTRQQANWKSYSLLKTRAVFLFLYDVALLVSSQIFSSIKSVLDKYNWTFLRDLLKTIFQLTRKFIESVHKCYLKQETKYTWNGWCNWVHYSCWRLRSRILLMTCAVEYYSWPAQPSRCMNEERNWKLKFRRYCSSKLFRCRIASVRHCYRIINYLFLNNVNFQ